jgi:multiple sugar transport system permease protein
VGTTAKERRESAAPWPLRFGSPGGASYVIGKLLRDIYKHRTDYLYIAPATTLFMVFLIYPAFRTLYISFFNWHIRGPSDFSGLKNYGTVLADSAFRTTFATTLTFTVGITLGAMLFGFIAALLVNDLLGWSKYYIRAAIFTPSIASLVVTAFIWRSFLEPHGLFQTVTDFLGLQMPSWLGDPNLAILALIVLSVWQQVGYTMVFFLAGLQNIPQMFYEAAEVDGAGDWDKLRHITLPLLQRTTLFILVVTSLANFKIFEQVFALTGGGPAGGTQTLMIYIFQSAFRYTRYGFAAAMAIVFSLLSITVALAQIRFLRARFEY